MKKFKPLILLLLVGMIAASGAFAQTTPDSSKYDKKYYPKKSHKQLEDFQNGDAIFPPKPKSKWSVGAKAGFNYIKGDVAGTPQFGAYALDVRKAIGHIFSLRLQFNYAQAYGQDYRPRTGYLFGPDASAASPNPWKLAGYTNSVFMNYRTRTIDANIQAVINLNNINFYKEENKLNLYGAFGIGAVGINTAVETVNDNMDRYDFNGVTNITAGTTFGEFRSEKQAILSELETRMGGAFPGDFDFETPAELYTNDRGINLGDNFYKVKPIFTAAAGLRYKLSKVVELELEYRSGITFDDMLDGLKWTEQGNLSSNWDNMNQMTIGLHFRLGGGKESHWWGNPLSDAYSAAADARKLVQKMLEDTDGDGVNDLTDQEPDTPEGMPVDAHGVTLDSDNDGVPDRDDAEKFSIDGAVVDDSGKALDEDADGVPDIRDKELGTEAGAQVDAWGRKISTGVDREEIIKIIKENERCLLPMIHFDLDKSEIKPEFYPELYYIAQIMKEIPNLQVKAVGHTDVRANDQYNQELSERRVNNTIDFLVNTYGIDRSRFEASADGELSPMIPELPPNYGNRKLEPLHYMNRRVQFECYRK